MRNFKSLHLGSNTCKSALITRASVTNLTQKHTHTCVCVCLQARKCVCRRVRVREATYDYDKCIQSYDVYGRHLGSPKFRWRIRTHAVISATQAGISALNGLFRNVEIKLATIGGLRAPVFGFLSRRKMTAPQILITSARVGDYSKAQHHVPWG